MPRGNVYAFEMDSQSFALLQQNVAANDLANVAAHNLAVADVPGVVAYRPNPAGPHPELRLQGDAEGIQAGAVQVDAVTLDDFLGREGVAPDVVKIDVEGAEMKVLLGMHETLRRHRPTLFMEIHPANLPTFGSSTAAILSLLGEHGYRLFEIEDLRGQAAEPRLKPLSLDATLDGNAMVYATVT
jgi:FkbM family methyltransferase